MPTDILIDPKTLDFVDDGAGGWSEVDDSRTAVMVQVGSYEGEWFGDPEAGSQNHALITSDEPVEPEELVDSQRRALQVLQRAGLISDVSVSVLAEDDLAGALSILSTWRDRASDRVVDLAYPSIGLPRPQ